MLCEINCNKIKYFRIKKTCKHYQSDAGASNTNKICGETDAKRKLHDSDDDDVKSPKIQKMSSLNRTGNYENVIIS